MIKRFSQLYCFISRSPREKFIFQFFFSYEISQPRISSRTQFSCKIKLFTSFKSSASILTCHCNFQRCNPIQRERNTILTFDKKAKTLRHLTNRSQCSLSVKQWITQRSKGKKTVSRADDVFRLQTPTFNWPKQEFCTLYIFYYKETENIYPYYVSSDRSPLLPSDIYPPLCHRTIHHPLATLASIFRLYGCVHSPVSYTLLFSRHHTKKSCMNERTKKKEGEQGKNWAIPFSYLNKDWALFSYTWCSPF